MSSFRILKKYVYCYTKLVDLLSGAAFPTDHEIEGSNSAAAMLQEKIF